MSCNKLQIHGAHLHKTRAQQLFLKCVLCCTTLSFLISSPFRHCSNSYICLSGDSLLCRFHLDCHGNRKGAVLACDYGEESASQLTPCYDLLYLDEHTQCILPDRYQKTCSLWVWPVAITHSADLTRCPTQGSVWTFTTSHYATCLNMTLTINCRKTR